MNRQIIEELINAGDPYALATMIAGNKFPDIPQEELRELLARAYTAAAHLERQANSGEDLGGAMARQLDTMSLDLRYNPGQLSLLDQIYLFYPKLKPNYVQEVLQK